MKILFYRYGSICEPDLTAAFSEYGFEITEVTEEIHNKAFSPQEGVALVSRILMEQPFDAVFSMNFYPFLAEVCNVMKLRYLCLVVDSPVMELYSASVRHPWNRIFLFDRTLYQEISPMNPSCVFHLPLAVNVAQKQQAIAAASPACKKRFTSDISFVGSLYTEKCPFNNLTDPPDKLRGYLNGLIEAQLRIYGYYLIDDVLSEDVVADFKQHTTDFPDFPYASALTDRVCVSQYYIGSRITTLERSRMLAMLSDSFSVDLYTASNTDALPHIHAKGTVKTLTEMPVIFHESRINLNMTAKSIRSALPLRVWDILGCGGFCLTNYQSELSDYFTIGEDLETYSSAEELKEKCGYYLAHENRRREIAQNALENVRTNHTWFVRLAQLMELAFAH